MRPQAGLVVTAAALFASAAVQSASEEVRRAWTVSPAAEQLREAHGILTALPAEAQRLPISGYLPHPPPWLPGPWADFLMGLESAFLEEAEMLGLVEAISRWRSEGGPTPPSSLQDVAESLRRLRASLPSWGGTAKFDVETEDGPSPRPRQWHPMQELSLTLAVTSRLGMPRCSSSRSVPQLQKCKRTNRHRVQKLPLIPGLG
ncbi:unnamed protein product [Symbiodinium microadriaticum]|nr:unnamed protein product [Symbiodinium microadriaticum]